MTLTLIVLVGLAVPVLSNLSYKNQPTFNLVRLFVGEWRFFSLVCRPKKAKFNVGFFFSLFRFAKTCAPLPAPARTRHAQSTSTNSLYCLRRKIPSRRATSNWWNSRRRWPTISQNEAFRQGFFLVAFVRSVGILVFILHTHTTRTQPVATIQQQQRLAMNCLRRRVMTCMNQSRRTCCLDEASKALKRFFKRWWTAKLTKQVSACGCHCVFLFAHACMFFKNFSKNI